MQEIAQDTIEPPAKKARTSARGGPACSRCHGRKARCDRPDPAKACRNCEVAGVDCVQQTKVPRKRKAPGSATNQQYATQLPQWMQQAGDHSFDVLINPPLPQASTSQQRDYNLPQASTSHQASYAPSPAQPETVDDQTESMSGSTVIDQSLIASGGSQLDDKRLGSVARSVAFLSLNASADASFLGASSGFSWTELVVSGLLADSKLDNASWIFDSDGPPTKLPSPYLEDVSAETASSIFDICYKHIQPRYPFTDWLRMHRWFNERISIMRAASQPGASPGTRAAALFLWLFFALGTSLSRRSPLPGLVSSASYFEQALEHLDAVASMHNLVGLQTLLLLSMYSLQRPAGSSLWFLSGSAMRLAIAMGLHRKLPPERERAIGFYAAEMRKRCFWSAYVDRMVAMTLGRPFGISDSAIDADLPMDVNCVQIDWPSQASRGATSMTSALHHIRLKRIDSKVHEAVYRVDTPEPDMVAAANLLNAVDMWTLGIPQEASTDQAKTLPCCSRDWFLLKAEQTKQHLLRPLTTYERDRSYWLTLCAQSAAATCEAQRRLHQGRPFSPTITALHSVFLSGITLLHCVRTFSGALTQTETHKAIRATSNILYSYAAEYSQVAQTFYDTFEALAELCLTPTAAPANQDPWAANLADLASNMPAGTEIGAFLQSLGWDPALKSFLDETHQVPPVSAANYDTPAIQVPFSFG